MINANIFFLIFFITISLTRIFLFFKPIASPTIANFRLHHYMFGILGILIGFYAKSVFIYAFGLGLFIDELAFLIIRGKNHSDNYSYKSILGTLFFVIIIFIFRNFFSGNLFYLVNTV
jgi:type III secretory pathway component EscT